MAKNYATIYNSANDAISLEQRFYVKVESARGTLVAPANSDFFFTLGGGSIAFNQPFESSPHRTGRHHTSNIFKKKELSWSLSTYFNIDETLGSNDVLEIDPALRVLFKSCFGAEDITGSSPVYTTATPPDITFSIHEVGDKFSNQARGCFVQGLNMNFPGNGEATLEWSGAGVESYKVGMGKSTVNNTANTVTLQTGEGDQFAVGALVMIIEANGTTRSADTPAGTARTITAISGDVVTLSGAVLSDANGSVTPIYLTYYEPSAPTAINNPVTGLVGSASIASTTIDCFRNVSVAITNEHELVDYCYGEDALHGTVFVPGNRFTAALTVEANLNKEIVSLFNRVLEFEAQDFNLVLGAASGRRFELDIPKVQFAVPAIAVPDNGSIPVSFTGNALQTGFDLADEVTASFL